jgi:hypothetical protein
MPVVPYYRGRPARAWVAAMSGRSPAETAADTSAGPSPDGQTVPASLRPTASAAQERTQQGADAATIATASASAWSAWASYWFIPQGRS